MTDSPQIVTVTRTTVTRTRANNAQGVYLTLLEIALALRHLHSRRLVHRGE